MIRAALFADPDQSVHFFCKKLKLCLCAIVVLRLMFYLAFSLLLDGIRLALALLDLLDVLRVGAVLLRVNVAATKIAMGGVLSTANSASGSGSMLQVDLVLDEWKC